MDVDQLVKWEFAGQIEVPRENPPHCYFVHHKPNMTQPGIKPGLLE
jgi:hypothetical protein